MWLEGWEKGPLTEEDSCCHWLVLLGEWPRGRLSSDSFWLKCFLFSASDDEHHAQEHTLAGVNTPGIEVIPY